MSAFWTVVTGRIVQGHEVCSETKADGENWTPEAKQDVLKSLGVTHILNLHDGRYWPDSGFLYHFVPLVDDKQDDKPVSWFKDCLDFILPLLPNPAVRVYIHCVAGVARSSAITYAVLRAVGVPAEMARALPEKRPGFEPVYLGSQSERFANSGTS